VDRKHFLGKELIDSLGHPLKMPPTQNLSRIGRSFRRKGSMSKLKVFQLAKELNISSKGLLYRLEKLGIMVRGHMSILADDEVTRIKEALATLPAEEKAEKKTIEGFEIK
jgi:Zn-dependent peptidase ImmA (M78 family)